MPQAGLIPGTTIADNFYDPTLTSEYEAARQKKLDAERRKRIANDPALNAAKAEVVANATAKGKASRQRASDTSSPGNWLEGIARDVGAIGGYAFTGGPITDAIADYTPGAAGKGLSGAQDAAVNTGRFLGGAQHNVAAAPFNIAAGNSLIPDDSTLGQAGEDIYNGAIKPIGNAIGGAVGGIGDAIGDALRPPSGGLTPEAASLMGGAGGGGAGGGAGSAGRARAEGQLTSTADLRNQIMNGPGTDSSAQRDVAARADNFQPTNAQNVMGQVQGMNASGAQRGAAASVAAYQPTAQQGAQGRVAGFSSGMGNVVNEIGNFDATAAQRGAAGALSGYMGGPRAQTGVANSAANFNPMAAEGLLGELASFRERPEGPSKAELLLKQAQDDGLSDTLALARSGRGGAGAAARAMNVAVAENAATQQGNARDMSLLRAEEEQQFRNQLLSSLGISGNISGNADSARLGALGIQGDMATSLDSNNVNLLGTNAQLASSMDQSGLDRLRASSDATARLDDATLRQLGLDANLAQGIDSANLDRERIGADLAKGIDDSELRKAGLTSELARSMDDSTLRALGISADTVNAIRQADVAERGQTLDATTALSGQENDLIANIMRDDLGYAQEAGANGRTAAQLSYELTPEQKMWAAKMGMGGDVLGFLGGLFS
jgi:hypothetical protein